MTPQAALAATAHAAEAGKISASARENIEHWLTRPEYAQFVPELVSEIEAGDWKTLNDVFWTVIPFGTGGRRGKMHAVGTNAINARTMGESAQGLADYVKDNQAPGSTLACAIAYDTRHRSREFAELCAGIMAAAGFQVYFLDGVRSTPELSVAVRAKRCACGIMITASHNPPSDNAVKAYWATGGQLLPPHDTGVIDRVKQVTTITQMPFDEAVRSGKVVFCQDEIDRIYIDAVAAHTTPGPRDIKIVYSPMHGVGASAVMPVLERAGFKDVELYAPQATPDGDFPNVPGHVSNPENPATFDALIARAKEIGAELVLSTDPDADRVGCAAAKSPGGEWTSFTGNQIGALLTDYVLSARSSGGKLNPSQFVAKTLVTSDMIARIAQQYGVSVAGNLLVGFKWIGEAIDQLGPEKFLIGLEESHGYLIGAYARDKDAAGAALLLAELTARAKAEGKTLYQQLEALYWQYGMHVEKQVNLAMPGAEGMMLMQALMTRLRENPPQTLGEFNVRQVRNYFDQKIHFPDGNAQPLDGPRGDMLIFDLDQRGHYAAVRPSGTEPKLKIYLFGYEAAEMLSDLDDARQEISDRLDRVAAALKQEAGI